MWDANKINGLTRPPHFTNSYSPHNLKYLQVLLQVPKQVFYKLTNEIPGLGQPISSGQYFFFSSYKYKGSVANLGM